MREINSFYQKLGVIAFLLLLALIVIQVVWMWKSVDLQQKENQLQLEQQVTKIALAIQAANPRMKKELKEYLIPAKIQEIKDSIDFRFKKEGLSLRPHFAIYDEKGGGFYASNTNSHRQELVESSIKSCLSCIVSFAFAKGMEQLDGESDEAFMERIAQNTEHQYFSPVSSFADEELGEPIIWLSLYQSYSIWEMIQSQFLIFIPSVLILLGLVYLFYFLLKSFSKHKKNSEAKNHFFNSMTHEFKTPLASIRLASRVLRKSTNPQKNETYHTLIEKESVVLETQIDKLLEYSLLDNEKIQLERIPLDINTCIQAAINRLKPQLEFSEAKIEVNLTTSPFRIQGDTYHLTNCFSNILENSLKYCPKGVYINITSIADVDKISVYIEDNGSGIEKEHIPYIYDKFYRGQKENQYKTQGFGIGLSYVKFIIETHGGTINYLPRSNGANFKIELPYA